MASKEISLPFRLDGQGRIATTADPLVRGRQRLTSYLLTRPSERLMRPSHGTAIRDLVFETLDPLQFDLLTRTVLDKTIDDVSGVVVKTLSAQTDSETGALMLTVEFALAIGAGEGEVLTSTISMGGGG